MRNNNNMSLAVMALLYGAEFAIKNASAVQVSQREF